MKNVFNVIQKNIIKFNVMSSANIDFWHSLEQGDWEPNTFRIFDNFLSKNCVYLDIGAWIGPTLLYAAQLAKVSYAFEPDPIAYQELEANVRANKSAEWAPRINIYNKAIAPRSGKITIGSRTSGGDSMSSVLFADEITNWVVEAITLGEAIEVEELHDEKLFIKIDIEGGEYDLIPRLKWVFRQYDIVLFLSIHPEYKKIDLFKKHIFKNEKNTLKIKILKRFLVGWHQIKLIRALPFRYLYYNNGKQTNLLKEIIKYFSRHTIHTTELVASNKPWDSQF